MTMTNAQAALLAASNTTRSTRSVEYGPGRNGVVSSTYSETPDPQQITAIATAYLEWLNTAERGTLEERVTRIEEEIR